MALESSKRKSGETLSFRRTPVRKPEPGTTAMGGTHHGTMYGRGGDRQILKNNL